MTTAQGELNLQRSQAMMEEASSFSPRGVPNCKWWAPDTFYVKSAKGSRIYDVDGNEYLDYWCGAGPHILGHAPSEVIEAVTEAINEGNVQFAMPNFRDVEVARKLTEFIPCAEKVALCVSGTDGLLYAIRLARAYTGKTKIVKFDGGYQGWADPLAVNSAPDSYDTGETKYATDSAGVPPDNYSNTVILPYNDLETASTRLHHEHNQIAAVLVETMIHSSNLIARPDFLEGLRRICDELGIVLIFDEIVTGFRHGLGGGQAIYGVTPDLGVFGKAMASGYVIAAICGKNEVMSAGGAGGNGTYSGNVRRECAGHGCGSEDAGDTGAPRPLRPPVQNGRHPAQRGQRCNKGARPEGALRRVRVRVVHVLQRRAAPEPGGRGALPAGGRRRYGPSVP